MATYSGGAHVLSKDVVAIICFSILRALQGEDFAAMGLQHGEICDYISDELNSMPNEDIGDAAHRLMKSYHRDLLRFAGSGGIQRDNVASLAASCEKLIGCTAARQKSEMKKLTIHLNTNYEHVAIILRSIFFAVELTDDTLKGVMIPLLEAILSVYDESASKLYEMVVLALENVNFRPGEMKADMQLGPAVDQALSSIDSATHAPAKSDVIVGMIVCSILVAGQKLDKKSTNLRVKLFIGAEGNDNGLNRALRTTIGLDSAFHTFGRFLSMLLLKGGRALPPQFKQCGRKYASSLEMDFNSLPAFLRDQTTSKASV